MLTLSDLGVFTDPDQAIATSYVITALPTGGALQRYDAAAKEWVAVKANEVISASLIASNGLRYQPNANANGADTFSVKAVDSSNAQSAAVTVSIDVAAVNDAPVLTAPSSAIAATEDELQVLRLSDLGVYSDEEGDALAHYVITGLPTHGVLQRYVTETDEWVNVTENTAISADLILETGLRYVPNANANGADTFTVAAVDSEGAQGEAVTVNIDVAAVNDAPELTAPSSAIAATEDTAKVLSLSGLGTFSDVEDTAATSYVITGLPTAGALQQRNEAGVWVNVAQGATINASAITNGDLRYLPNANANGADSFAVRAVDSSNAQSAAVTVNINVAAVNDAPALTAPTASIAATEDTAKVLILSDLGVFTDPDQATATSYVITALPTGGVLQQRNEVGVWVNVERFATINASAITNGDLRYLPNTNANGADSFEVRAVDSSGAQSAAVTVSIDVAAVNDAPELTAPTASIAATEDTAKVLSLSDLGAFSDVEDTAATGYVITGLPAGGVLQQRNEAGVWVNVAQGATISASAITTGDLRYLPNANANGADSFAVRAVDSSGAQSAAVTVSINVAAVNDAPELTAPTASIAATEDTAKVLSVSDLGAFSDADGHSLTGFVITALPAGGVLQRYDAAAAVWVAVKANEVISASLIASNGLRYLPNANANGADTFEVRAVDSSNAQSAAVTVSIDVAAVNDAPVLAAPTAAIAATEDTAKVLSLSDLGTFSDVEDTAATSYVITVFPEGGVLEQRNEAGAWVAVAANEVISASWIANNGLRYLPNANAHGADSFEVRAVDSSNAQSAAVTVSINVAAVNDAPELTAPSSAISATEDTAKVLSLSDLGVFSDPDQATATSYEITGLPTGGVLQQRNEVGVWVNVERFATINASAITNGDLRYLPNANANGADTFEVRAVDSSNAQSAAVTVNIQVEAVNDAPELAAPVNSVQALEGQNRVLSLSDLGVFSDAEDAAATSYVITALPSEGTLSVVTDYAQDFWQPIYAVGVVITAELIANGGLRYRANVFGQPTDAFSLRAIDSGNLESKDVTVRFSNSAPAVNSVPVLSAPPSSTATEDTVKVLSLSDLGTFSDADQATATYYVITDLPTRGLLQWYNVLTGAWANAVEGAKINAVLIDRHGLRYVPNANAHGADSFEVAAVDNLGARSTAVTVNIDVAAVNDAPVLAAPTAAIAATEDTAKVLSLSDLGTFSDVEDTAATSYLITALPAGGVLQRYDAAAAVWVAVKANEVISASLIANNGLRYLPNADGTSTFSVKAVDSSGAQSAAVTVTISVAAVNDGPVIYLISDSDFINASEDTPRVLSLSDFGTYSDEEGDALAGYVITSLPAQGKGVLQQRGTDGEWVDVSENTFISASLIAEGGLRFLPYANANGADTFMVAAVDNRGAQGTAVVAAIVVAVVNDAPVLTAPSSAIAATEDTAKVLSLSDLGTFSDVEDTAATNYLITALPAGGVLQQRNEAGVWVNVAQGASISASAITNGDLRYLPNANANGADSFAVRAVDSSGAQSAAVTVSIDVAAVNDVKLTAPASRVAADSKSTLSLTLADFGVFSDEEDGPTATRYLLVSLPTHGSLVIGDDPELDAAGVWISAADIAAGLFRYVPSGYEGSASFEVRAADSEGNLSDVVTVNLVSLNADQFSEDDSEDDSEELVSVAGTPQVMVGGRGDNEFHSEAADVMYGGAGDDTFTIGQATVTGLVNPAGQGGNPADANNISRIDGGSGIDTVHLLGATTLDFSAISGTALAGGLGDARFRGIEHIDMRDGRSYGHVVLTYADIIRLDLGRMGWLEGMDANVRSLMISGDLFSQSFVGYDDEGSPITIQDLGDMFTPVEGFADRRFRALEAGGTTYDLYVLSGVDGPLHVYMQSGMIINDS